jgi:hypothetical protein
MAERMNARTIEVKASHLSQISHPDESGTCTARKEQGAMKRFGSATWNGGLREGKGSVSTESRALETYPYTFFSRYGEKLGTNPEEVCGGSQGAPWLAE